MSIAPDRVKTVRARRARHAAEPRATGDIVGSAAEHFRILVDAVEDCAIFSVDLGGRVSSWNRGAERILGWRADEVVGRPTSLFYPPDAVARGLPAAVLAEATSRGHAVFEGWGLRKDGTRFYAEVAVTALYDDARTVAGFAKVTRDVTARHTWEVHRRLWDDVHLVLSASLTDPEGALRAMADLMVRELADFAVIDLVQDAGELKRLTVACAQPQDAEVAESLRRLAPSQPGLSIRTEVARTGEARLFPSISRANIDAAACTEDERATLRRLAPRSVLIVPLAARGRILAVLALVRARTEEAYSESHLRFGREVGRMAGVHIDNARLYQAAQQSIAQRDYVLGVVAHDLRGPLSSIVLRTNLGLRRLARAQADDEPMGAALRAIQDSAMLMDRLISNLLDLTRSRRGRLEADPRRCAPAALVAFAVEQARPQAVAQAVHLRADIEPGLPEVYADRGRVLQCLSNLLGNALKFTPARGEIVAGVHSGDAQVVFEVRDTGAGISPQELPRVFDPFFQHNRTDRRGTGLGLGICKWIVESHGGTMTAESTLGKGSAFRFTLPVVS